MSLRKEGKKEMRLFERIPLKISVSLKKGDNQREKGYICDISGSGVGIVAKGNFPPGSHLELRPRLPKKKVAPVYRGRVVWTKRIDEENLKLGIEILPLNLLKISYLIKEYSPLQ